MNCRLAVFVALAVFAVGAIAVSEADVALIEQWAETAEQSRPQVRSYFFRNDVDMGQLHHFYLSRFVGCEDNILFSI